MKLNRQLVLFYVLLACVVLEILCCTIWQTQILNWSASNGPKSEIQNALNGNSIGYIIFGLAIAILPLINISTNVAETPIMRNTPVIGAIVLLALIFTGWLLHNASVLYATNALDYRHADMLPVIKVMNERWLHHENVYAIIPQFYSGEQPVYLPAMWMPFLPSIAMHFDLRWITLVAVLLGGWLILLNIKPRNWNWHSLIGVLPFFLLLTLLMESDYFRLTEEGVVVGFYLLLAYTLMHKNVWLTGIAISLCLLSRYSFAGWVPLFFLVSFFFVSKRQTIYAAVATALCSIILLVSSQAIYHLPFLLNLSDHYFSSIQNPDNKWLHESTIASGLGVAKWVPYASLMWLQRTLMVVTVLFPVVGLWVYRKAKNINKEYFMVAMLKLYLVIFYNLLVLPFTYLFFTSTFLSCFILYRYSKNIGEQEPDSLLNASAV